MLFWILVDCQFCIQVEFLLDLRKVLFVVVRPCIVVEVLFPYLVSYNFFNVVTFVASILNMLAPFIANRQGISLLNDPLLSNI